MNEELDSQLSAMFDGELSPAECELMARRLSRDEALKARWGRYAVIAAAIRSEQGVRLGADVAQRVRAALSSESELAAEPVVPARPARSLSRWWQPVAGIAVAAGVAAVSLLWLREQSPLDPQTLVAQSNVPPVAAPEVATSQPDSYVVPAPAEPRAVVPGAELANYVVAHSEFSTPLSRRNLLSALMASDPGTATLPGESEEAFEGSDAGADDAQ